MRGCLLIAVSFAAALGLGVVVGRATEAITGNQALAGALGTGVWIVSGLLLAAYGSLWIARPEDLFGPSTPSSTVGGWRAAKAESKLQTAELRVGFVFGMIGGSIAQIAGASAWGVTVAAICSVIVGAVIGLDLKRRVLRMREEIKMENARGLNTRDTAR